MESYFFEEKRETAESKLFVLIIYDIIENKKRVKLAKLLLGYGFRIQKSAFEAELTRKKYEKLLSELKAYEDPDDSIRVYQFSGRRQVTVLGRDDTYSIEDVLIL